MSKYICNQCGQPAEHVDFLNNDEEHFISAVYVYCLPCKLDAWGGIRFHPEMNELLNKRFSPNYNHNPTEQSRSYTLVQSKTINNETL